MIELSGILQWILLLRLWFLLSSQFAKYGVSTVFDFFFKKVL